MRLFEKLEKWFSLNKKKVSPDQFEQNLTNHGFLFLFVFLLEIIIISIDDNIEIGYNFVFYFLFFLLLIFLFLFLYVIVQAIFSRAKKIEIKSGSIIVSEGRVLRTYMIGMKDWKSNIPADELKDIEKGQLIQGVFRNRKIIKTVILDQDSVEPDILVVVVLAPFETKEGIQSYYDFLRKYNFCECTIAKIIDAIVASCLFDGILYSYAKSLCPSTNVDAQRNDSKSEFSRFLSERLDKIGMTLISCNIEAFDPQKNKENHCCGNSC